MKKDTLYMIIGIVAVLLIGTYFFYDEIKDYEPKKMVDVYTYGDCHNISSVILEHQGIYNISDIYQYSTNTAGQHKCRIFYGGTQ